MHIVHCRWCAPPGRRPSVANVCYSEHHPAPERLGFSVSIAGPRALGISCQRQRGQRVPGKVLEIVQLEDRVKFLILSASSLMGGKLVLEAGRVWTVRRSTHRRSPPRNSTLSIHQRTAFCGSVARRRAPSAIASMTASMAAMSATEQMADDVAGGPTRSPPSRRRRPGSSTAARRKHIGFKYVVDTSEPQTRVLTTTHISWPGASGQGRGAGLGPRPVALIAAGLVHPLQSRRVAACRGARQRPRWPELHFCFLTAPLAPMSCPGTSWVLAWTKLAHQSRSSGSARPGRVLTAAPPLLAGARWRALVHSPTRSARTEFDVSGICF